MWFLLLSIFSKTLAIPIDNGVIGDPEIQCASDSIGLSTNTKNPFEGQIFVKASKLTLPTARLLYRVPNDLLAHMP